MKLSLKNVERAAKMTGLDSSGPILASEKDQLLAKTARLAEFLDRHEAMMRIDPVELPPSNLKKFAD